MKSKRFVLVVCAMALTVGLSTTTVAQTQRPATPLPFDSAPDWKTYTEALELLAAGNKEEAIQAFREVTTRWPDSPLAPRATAYLDDLESRRDRSGFVGFYLGTMSTLTYAAYTIPIIADLPLDGVFMGLYGLAGVGGGFASSWALTKGREWSFAQEAWVELTQAVSLTNVELAFVCWGEELFAAFDADTLIRINLGLSTAVALGTRAGTYLMVRDQKLDRGRPVFAAAAYGWASFYTTMTTAGLLQLDGLKSILIPQMLIPDTALVTAALSWDSVDWSAGRTGLVSVAGLGGILTGSFVNVIIDGIGGYLDERVSVGVIMAGAIAGTWAGAVLTKNFDSGSTAFATRERGGSPVAAIMPITGLNGELGAALSLSY